MKLTIPATELKKIVKAISPVVADKKIGSDTLTFEPDMGRFNVADPELGVTVYRPDIQDLKLNAGSISVSATEFSRVVNVLRGDVTLEDGPSLSIKAGKASYTLSYLQGTVAPVAVPDEKAVSLDAVGLKDVLTKAQSVFVGGAFYTVAKLVLTGTAIRSIATDGVRLIISEFDCPVPDDDLLISQRAVAAILNLPGDKINVVSTKTANFFISDGVTIVNKKMAVDFPKYEVYLKDITLTCTYVVDAFKVSEALARLAPMIDEESSTVKLVFSSGQLQLSTTAGDAVDVVPLVADTCDPFEDLFADSEPILLKYKHLTSFFKLVKGDVNIGVQTPAKPVVFEAGRTKLILAPVVR